MLDQFPVETPIVQPQIKPVELEGFYTEAPLTEPPLDEILPKQPEKSLVRAPSRRTLIRASAVMAALTMTAVAIALAPPSETTPVPEVALTALPSRVVAAHLGTPLPRLRIPSICADPSCTPAAEPPVVPVRAETPPSLRRPAAAQNRSRALGSTRTRPEAIVTRSTPVTAPPLSTRAAVRYPPSRPVVVPENRPPAAPAGPLLAARPSVVPTAPANGTTRETSTATATAGVAPTPPLERVELEDRTPMAAVPTRPISTPSARAMIADEVPAIRNVIARYQQAYQNLDAAAVKRIWPSVDERALARAFGGLQSQTMTLNPCEIDVTGTGARASCRGAAGFTGRVGNRNTPAQAREWRFTLRKAAGAWQIDSVRTAETKN